MIVCPNCKSVLEDGTVRCTACGMMVKQSPLVTGDYGEYSKTQSSVVKTSLTSQTLQECLSCGAMFPYDPHAQKIRCPICGKLMSGAVEKKKHRDKRWTAGRAIALFCLLLTIASTYLPFYSFTFFGIAASISLWSKNFLVLAIFGAVIVLIGIIEVFRNASYLSKEIIAIGVFILSDIIFQYLYNKDNLTNVKTELGTFDLSGLLFPGPGFVMMVLASIGMIVSGIVIASERRE